MARPVRSRWPLRARGAPGGRDGSDRRAQQTWRRGWMGWQTACPIPYISEDLNVKGLPSHPPVGSQASTGRLPALPSDRAAPPPVTRREIVSWAMLDFANSSYTTVIVTVAYSVFFTRLVAAGPDADLWWGRGVLIANLIVLLLSPLVGAIADESGRKKHFLAASWLVCVAGTAALVAVGP